MSKHIHSSHDFAQNQYDEIIDVRSPSEFTDDHIPGAINLPVLTDDERQSVGTIYKQVNPFEAKKLGAALISTNISASLKHHFLDKDKKYRPLVYCWRGGQRSGSFAIVLSQIGWDVTVLKGGYKYYRSQVRESLENKTPELDYCILAGLTGTAKTRILALLKTRGEQVIDLENLASHKGSLLGQIPNKPQPTQKLFESSLSRQIQNFSNQQVTWIESESSKVGKIHIPQSLWNCMKNAKVFEINASLDTRIAYIIKDYPWFTKNKELIRRKIPLLKNAHGLKQIEEWCSLIECDRWDDLVGSLLVTHYDPSYSRSLINNNRTASGNITLSKIDDNSLVKVADKLIHQTRLNL